MSTTQQQHAAYIVISVSQLEELAKLAKETTHEHKQDDRNIACVVLTMLISTDPTMDVPECGRQAKLDYMLANKRTKIP